MPSGTRMNIAAVCLYNLKRGSKGWIIWVATIDALFTSHRGIYRIQINDSPMSANGVDRGWRDAGSGKVAL
jgi:hypothetical protein